ncbi:hypothetical protein AMATHDRAFT_54967 [Amanita thiersii Skay4041]|uniref:Prephenate/arogenate dehydrogenase domain-containing protein n=1 Tax=Amanita thiersii Skay4041 TaxID=703135 RepID=A0A2A9NQK5_9AGAR|nr:hypothetical protein AMATHDRAFT_54967 [Amanita thiersii Skay4041]
MGRMYASLLSNAGWKKIYVCDIPSKYNHLCLEYANTPGVLVCPDGHAVSRASDFIIYSVEAEHIDKAVKEYGPSTKHCAIVAGQTSVKAPEQAAFENYLPEDTHIVSCHSLHGPTVSPIDQPLVLIRHRGPPEALTLVESILRCFRSRYVYMSYRDHDLVTANTQAVTHAAFLSMGSAWASARWYPWEHGLYVGGIETAKVNLTLRIYSNAWHVYAGLAILNPSARVQIDQYAKSATELFKLMLAGGNGTDEDKRAFRQRVEWGRQIVFGDRVLSDSEKAKRRPILLSEDVLDRFSLGKAPQVDSSHTRGAQDIKFNGYDERHSRSGRPSPATNSTAYAPESGSSNNDPPPVTISPRTPSTVPPTRYRPNSHLSLLAMVDSWAHLKINPYTHLALAATPLFRLFLGVAEHLFMSPNLLQASTHSALHDTWHRGDDLEFVIAARGWSQCVNFESFEVYRKRFQETRMFFEARFEEASKVGSAMIKALMETEIEREKGKEDSEKD